MLSGTASVRRSDKHGTNETWEAMAFLYWLKRSLSVLSLHWLLQISSLTEEFLVLTLTCLSCNLESDFWMISKDLAVVHLFKKKKKGSKMQAFNRSEGDSTCQPAVVASSVLASAFPLLCPLTGWQRSSSECYNNNVKPCRHSFSHSWFVGLETKVLSFLRSEGKQNEQKCQKINSSIFLVLNQVTNQENKTFCTDLKWSFSRSQIPNLLCFYYYAVIIPHLLCM